MRPPLSLKVVHWGWVRLVLGVLQISCSAYAVFLIFQIGLQPIAWVFIFAAFAATGVSRLLYRGRPGPALEDREGQDERTQ